MTTADAQDDRWLARAVALSRAGMRAGEGGPFGAVVVRGARVLGEGWNRVTATADPTAHAEVVAIRRACRRVRTFALPDAVVYASCEPCPMCWAACSWARVDRVVYANTRDQAAAIGFDDADLYEQLARPPSDRAVVQEHRPREDAARVLQDWAADPRARRY